MNRWNADIIRDTETNHYRALFTFYSGPGVEAAGDGWRELCDNVTLLTGIRLPHRKWFSFSKLSDWEQIAGIDASHTRQTCIVSRDDRRQGWRREIF